MRTLLDFNYWCGGHAMFWILIFLGALALTFTKLGAYFVMTKVLVSGLYVAILLIAALLLILLWRKVSGKRHP